MPRGHERGQAFAVDTSTPPLETLCRDIGFPVEARALLVTALSHISFAHEHQVESNERLEFLGDAVLGLIVGDYLFRNFPQAQEGWLAKNRAQVISAPVLAQCAKALGLGSYLRLGHGEAASGGAQRDSNLADAFEAVAGGFFVQGGLENARAFILANLEKEILTATSGLGKIDYKTMLQEELQKNGRKPIYAVIGEKGPDHCKEFTISVSAGELLLGQGQGCSKKEAEQAAARLGLGSMEQSKKKDLFGDC